MKYTEKVLSDILITARSRSGLTQTELARKARTKQAAISRAEKGNVSSLRWVDKVVRACGLELRFHHVSLVRKHKDGEKIDTLFFG